MIIMIIRVIMVIRVIRVIYIYLRFYENLGNVLIKTHTMVVILR